MSTNPGDTLRSARHGASTAAARWRLPFSRQAWRGLSGNWLGAGAGSSLGDAAGAVAVASSSPAPARGIRIAGALWV